VIRSGASGRVVENAPPGLAAVIAAREGRRHGLHRIGVAAHDRPEVQRFGIGGREIVDRVERMDPVQHTFEADRCGRRWRGCRRERDVVGEGVEAGRPSTVGSDLE